MRRLLTSLSTALVFVALALALFQPYPARTVRAADINEKCTACLARTQAQYEQCQAQFGLQRRYAPHDRRLVGVERTGCRERRAIPCDL